MNGPTSASRTKIGETPIATAPATSAAKGARTPPRGAAGLRLRRQGDIRPRGGGRSARIGQVVHSLAPTGRQAAAMDRTQRIFPEPDADASAPVETIAGPLDAGVLLVCDHASNALPPGYGTLGLPARGARAPHRLRHRRGGADAGAGRAARRARRALDLLAPADRPQPRRRRSDARHALFRRGDRARQRARRRGRDRAEARPLLGALSRDGRGDRRGDAGEPASRRRSSRSIPSRPSGAARLGAGKSACCGTTTTASPRRSSPRSRAEADLHGDGDRRQRAL